MIERIFINGKLYLVAERSTGERHAFTGSPDLAARAAAEWIAA